MNPKILIGVLILLGSALIGIPTWVNNSDATKPVTILRKELPAKPAPSSEGKEAKLGGSCDYSNGWNICPVGNANIPAFWRIYHVVVGDDAVGPFSASNGCQPFANARLCISNIPGYEVQISNSGEEQLRRERLQVNRGADLHPAVADLIKHNMSIGITKERAVGDVLSRPICAAGHCRQFVQKVVFYFAENATLWDEVQMEPVEEQLRFPAPPPEFEEGRTEYRPIPWDKNLPLILGMGLAALLAISGLAVLLLGLLGGDDSGRIR